MIAQKVTQYLNQPISPLLFLLLYWQKEDIYVGDLSKGMYFGNLVNNDKVVAVKKLIIK